MRRGTAYLALLLIIAFCQPAAATGPALVFEATSGKVLYAEDVDNQWYPASLTKLMTAYLAFEAIKSGRLSLKSKISCSAAAHKEPPSKIGLPIGGELTVDKALQALIVKSANDVAVMLAEAIGGNEEQFVNLMNATAKRLGMARTNFANPNGLPAPEQVTTARDLGKLARAIITEFPEYDHYWSMLHMRLGKNRLQLAQRAPEVARGRRRSQDGVHLRFRLQHHCQRHARWKPARRRRARRFLKRGAQRARGQPFGARVRKVRLGADLQPADRRQHPRRADGGRRHQRAQERCVLGMQSAEEKEAPQTGRKEERRFATSPPWRVQLRKPEATPTSGSIFRRPQLKGSVGLAQP